MKNFLFLLSFRHTACLAAAVFSWLNFGSVSEIHAIPLVGANGRTAEFAGIKSAGPKGLTVQLKEGDQVFELGWDKLDLAKVNAQYPNIAAAYKKALGGEVTELNLGSFAPKKPVMVAKPDDALTAVEKEGFFQTTVSGSADAGFNSALFAVSLPETGDPKGILLLALGQDGNSARYMSYRRTAGPWQTFQKDLGFAILGYEFRSRSDAEESTPFKFAERGSGEALLEGLNTLSERSGKKLSDLPIAIYGREIAGAAFAFNLAQWKPERVIAAVVSKGAFYATPPTPESVKVPLLMIWGEYDREPEIAKASHTHAEIFGNHMKLNPNWIYAMEPRGQSGDSPQSAGFSEIFLKKMIEARMSDEGLVELDRSESWVGDLDKFTISKLEDPEGKVTPTQTWLPNQELAEKWEQFVNGRFPLDGAAAP